MIERNNRIAFRRAVTSLLLVCGIGAGSSAHADLVLTSYASSHGFGLSVFATGVGPTSGCCGPLGIASNSAGQIVMQQYNVGLNRVFNDIDGQTAASQLSQASWASFGYGSAIVSANGVLYATNNDAGQRLAKLNNDGSFNTYITPNGIGYGGLATNPITGHLISAGSGNGSTGGGGIFDTNPVTGVSTLIVPGVFPDGISVSADGSTIYVANGGHVQGFNYLGILVYDSGYIGSPDGTGVISGGNPFSGDIVANANDGTVWLLNTHGLNLPDLATTATLLAIGGTRGDYVGVDGNNGSLFLTQSSTVDRLVCGEGCSFGPPPRGVPEPPTIILGLLGLVALLGVRRAKKSTSIPTIGAT